VSVPERICSSYWCF